MSVHQSYQVLRAFRLMKKQTIQKNQSTYYWVSWKRIALIAVPCGMLTFIACLMGEWRGVSTLMLSIALSSFVALNIFVVLGVKYIKIVQDRVSYQNGPLWRSSTNIENIIAVKIVSRFAFTDKATIVYLEFKEGGGMHGGMLVSRDMFPDDTIAALVNHLKHLNPTITLDDGVQEILRSHEKTVE